MVHTRVIARSLAVIGAATLLLSACSTAKDPSESSSQAESALQRIEGSGTVKICTTGDYRPFTYLDPNTDEWSGIDIDMAKNLAASLGAEVEFVSTSWDDFTADMQDSCDVGVGGLSISTERATQMYMSDATVQDGKTPITLCQSQEKYDSIEKINDESVDVITPVGGTNEEFAEKHFPDANIIRWDDNNTIFDQIVAGDADVMVTDAPETKWVSHTEQKLCAVNPGTPLNFSEQGYAVRLGDEEMLEYVNTWLRIVKNDGTYSAAEKKWYG